MAEQLTFDLPAVEARGLGDFFVSPSNQAAYSMIEGWQAWPGNKLILSGPAGSGKTHLAHVWAGLSGAHILRAADLEEADIQALAGQCAMVEDAEDVAGDAGLENALFHLHNLVLAEGGSLLVTARGAPSRWGLALPDLASRMKAAPIATLQTPDDMLLAVVLVKLFSDRQITVPPNLITYLTLRMDRSLAAASKLVARLDALALAENRPVTRALAARVLDNRDETGA